MQKTFIKNFILLQNQLNVRELIFDKMQEFSSFNLNAQISLDVASNHTVTSLIWSWIYIAKSALPY